MPPNDLGVIDNPRAVIGDNAAPVDPPTPFEIAEKAVNDIYDEAMLWLDGKPITSRALADGVANLLSEIRKAEKLADDTRVAEKAPLDEAIKAVQARYAPLIADTKTMKGKTVLAAAACKQALQPWLDAEDRRIREEARVAREEADRQQREAEQALRASEVSDLTARAEAEAMLSQAKKAGTLANTAERQTAKAGGAFGRAAALRTVWVTTITDPAVCARHYWTEAQADMLEFLHSLTERDVRLGKRAIPGVEIAEKKVAV